jgi:REP element-mobilizing transposase RayT
MLSNFEPETFYHLFNHAVGNENLFREEKNYLYFLKKMAFYLPPVCHTYAYCLLPNHFHILVKFHNEKIILNAHQQNGKNQSDADFHKIVMKPFKNLCSTYAQAYNKMYGRKGALFLDYIKRKKVNKDTYFGELIRYIHLNPVRHGFCKSPFEWKYSSIHAFASSKKTLIRRDEVLEWFGNIKEFEKFHQNTDFQYASNFEPLIDL